MFKSIEEHREYMRKWRQLNKEKLRKKDRDYYRKNRGKILQQISERNAKKQKKSTLGKLIEHHIKYKEIHGVDETVLIPFGEHIQIHRRLRKMGKCNIPIDELNRISHLAKNRTEKVKARRKRKEFTSSVGKYIQLVEEIIYDLKTDHVGYRARFRQNYSANSGTLKVINETQLPHPL